MNRGMARFRRSASVGAVLGAVVATALLGSSPASAATTESLFGSSTPTTAANSDNASLTVGVKFTTKTAGSITGVRFYKGSSNTGEHIGALYSSSGSLLAEADFTGESSTGWQSVSFSTPVDVDAGDTYTAATYMPAGHYSLTESQSWPVQRTNLTGISGTYRYGTGLRFPSATYRQSNYFVDVAFTADTTTAPGDSPDAPAEPAAPAPGGFPNADNTGVPAGTTLSSYTGPTTITRDGTVIDSKLITGCLDIEADNVTIKNSLIQSRNCFFNVLADNGNTGLKLTDVEIDGLGNTSNDSAINGENFTCLRCDLHGTTDGVKPGDNVVIQDSYIHDLAMTSDSHNDGIQSLGTTSLRILHNTIISPRGSTSAIILSTGSAWAMRNVQIDNNLLGGGAYTVYGGYLAGTDSLSKIGNISITNNHFTTVIYPRSGAFGALTSISSPVTVSGNVWHDGPNAGNRAW